MSRSAVVDQVVAEANDANLEMQCSLSIKKRRLLPKIGTPNYGRKLIGRLLPKLLGEIPRVKARVSGNKIYGHGPNDERWPCSKVSFSLEQVSQPDFPERDDEIRCFILCRNEARRLPWLLKYHRSLGVDRFFVIDNGSTDGSGDFLSSQHDVHHFVTDDKFSEHRCGTNWLQALLQIYGSGYWCLTVDSDEMLVFPGSEALNLRDLRDFMEREEAEALFTLMIDMYQDPQGPGQSYKTGESFLSTSDTFDLGPYHALKDEGSLDIAAFQLHQAVEHAYCAVLLTLTLYTPKTHNIEKLRSFAESLDERLIVAWPRYYRRDRAAFDLLRRAYVEARYSPHYEITREQLLWLEEGVTRLHAAVKTVCEERLAG